jgi:uncharacterized integral membrane protein
MPWRLIIVIAIGVVFLGFIGFNLENTCNVSFGFHTFENVPVFLTALSSFVLGMVLTLPLVISFRSAARRKKQDPALQPVRGRGRKKVKAEKTEAPDSRSDEPPPPGGSHGID